MKRGTPDHIKTKRLSRRLKVPRYAAVGLLESLWHLTADKFPAGDIGRLSDEELAEYLDWEREPSELVEALVASGWLDRVEGEARLAVHDWWDHCEDSVHLWMVRKARRFACGCTGKASRLNKKDWEEEVAPLYGVADKGQLPRCSRHALGVASSDSSAVNSLCAQEAHEKRTAIASASASATANAIASASSSGESVPAEPSPNEESLAVLHFPLKGGATWPLRELQLAELQATFPALTVRSLCREAWQWCQANPSKRKTAKGMPAFLTAWMQREAEKSRSPQAGACPPRVAAHLGVNDPAKDYLDGWGVPSSSAKAVGSE